MAMFALLMFLIGMVLGLRFKVLVLVPAMAGLVPIALAIATHREHGLASVIIVSAATVACLQVGYIAGIAICYSAGGMRVSSRRDHSSLASQALPTQGGLIVAARPNEERLTGRRQNCQKTQRLLINWPYRSVLVRNTEPCDF